jgi:hypothetical protein
MDYNFTQTMRKPLETLIQSVIPKDTPDSSKCTAYSWGTTLLTLTLLHKYLNHKRVLIIQHLYHWLEKLFKHQVK